MIKEDPLLPENLLCLDISEVISRNLDGFWKGCSAGTIDLSSRFTLKENKT